MWLIEENANNFFNEVCLKPPKAPVIAEIRMKGNKKLGLLKIINNIIIGANFCHVSKISTNGQVKA